MATDNPRKVLVVEDEGLIAHDIANRLEGLGHTVVATCGTAAEAVEHAAEAEVVLMDIRLDGPKDGITAAGEIRDRYQIPVIFLTGQSDHATIERAKAAEPFGYIVKPLVSASLQTSIEIAIYKHRMERELAAREAWLRTIFGATADAVIVVDPESRIVMLNRTAEVLTGWVQQQALGKPLAGVLRLEEETERFDPVALAMLRDEAVGLGASARLVSRSGRELMVEGAAAPVRASGMVLGAVLTLRDVSARRWQEQQLRQAQKLEAIGRLAAGVAAEYTGLLAVIRNQAEQLVEHFGDYSPARKAAERIAETAAEAQRLNRKLEAMGARQVGPTEILSVNGMVRRTAKLIESLLGAGVELSIRLDPSAGKIQGDPERMEQVLMGLVMHAASRMPGRGRLEIATSPVEMPQAAGPMRHTMLTLSHTGEEADPEKLFEPASMEDDGVTMSMIHAIVTEHGGYVSVRPAGEGGWCFEVLFPSAADPALLISAVPSPGANAPTVLLIEPREALRVQIHNYFEANGYNLLEAADRSEAEAIAEVHDGQVSLVIAGPDDVGVLGEVKTLCMVDGPERSEYEIRRPFTQQELLERARRLIGARAAGAS
jgi:two-component system cell cycle sensor histidine kinase/response regulator CckA